MSKYLAALKNLFIKIFSNNENVGLSSLARAGLRNPQLSGNKDIKFSDILKR